MLSVSVEKLAFDVNNIWDVCCEFKLWSAAHLCHWYSVFLGTLNYAMMTFNSLNVWTLVDNSPVYTCLLLWSSWSCLKMAFYLYLVFRYWLCNKALSLWETEPTNNKYMVRLIASLLPSNILLQPIIWYHSMYGLSQWEMVSHCNTSYWLSPYPDALPNNGISTWLSPYPEWSLYDTVVTV